jgi:hypothetical protein
MTGENVLTGRQIADYFHRSFTAVDGLWFMKVEEKFGFDRALEIDNQVWKVMPRIQIRELKSMLKVDRGLAALKQCLTADLTVKGFDFSAEDKDAGRCISMVVRRCPWHDTMVKSGREHLSAKVGNVICQTEYSVWAGEFGDGICFEQGERLCDGAKSCILTFMKEK